MHVHVRMLVVTFVRIAILHRLLHVRVGNRVLDVVRIIGVWVGGVGISDRFSDLLISLYLTDCLHLDQCSVQRIDHRDFDGDHT